MGIIVGNDGFDSLGNTCCIGIRSIWRYKLQTEAAAQWPGLLWCYLKLNFSSRILMSPKKFSIILRSGDLAGQIGKKILSCSKNAKMYADVCTEQVFQLGVYCFRPAKFAPHPLSSSHRTNCKLNLDQTIESDTDQVNTTQCSELMSCYTGNDTVHGCRIFVV